MSALSRRDLMKRSLLTGAGLFVAFHVPRKVRAAPEPPAKKPTDPNAFVRVAPDDTNVRNVRMRFACHRRLSRVVRPCFSSDQAG